MKQTVAALLGASILALGFCQSASGMAPAEPQLAFPTAEGYGKYTVGGRGGAVFEVTNLNDSGPGSLRAAVEAEGPRTIVFRVSGTIDLQSRLEIKHPYVTIAGQTAPGDGITLKRHPLIIRAGEVIIRYIRLRLGGESGGDYDALTAMYQRNIILDHISASWSVDETLSVYQNQNVTVQWSIISESLFNSNHVKGNHGYGAMWGSNYSSYHHNLIAHHSNRNPRIVSGAGFTDIRNNVIYNWGFESSYGGEMLQPNGSGPVDFTTVNLVGNYYKPGPATEPGPVSHRIFSPWSRNGAADYGKFHIAGNVVDGYPDISADNWKGGVQTKGGSEFDAGLRLATPWPAMLIREQSAEEAYQLVLAYAGATRPKRDAVDERIVQEVRTGTATFEGPTYKTKHKVADTTKRVGIIDQPADVGGWPILRSTPAPHDSDHDGMPDAWERANGLNPHDAADRNKVAIDGYTMLEKYLNSIG